jgi:hypothetical protein
MLYEILLAWAEFEIPKGYSTYIKIRKTRQQCIHKDKENKTAVHT